MTLASSGTMSIGGSTATRSINLELDRSETATTSLNETALRDLAEVSSGAISLNNFYEKSADSGYLPVSLSGTNSATDNSIPAQITPVDNVQITGTTYWRRVRLTYSGATGTKRLYVRSQANNDVTDFRADVQAIMYVLDGTEYQLVDQTNWERVARTTTTTQPTSGWATWNSYSAGGLWNTQTSGLPTGSSGTGRLQNFIDTSKGFIYIEASSTGTSIPKYYWLRGPATSLTTGAVIDFYYGVDCPAITQIYFYIA